MVDLAWAYDIDIPKDEVRSVILPIMLAAESQGAFNGKPKRPYYLIKASRTADEPIPDHPPFADTEDPFGGIPKLKRTNRAIGSGFLALQQECKRLGINSMGKSVEWMKDAVARVAPLQEVEEALAEAKPSIFAIEEIEDAAQDVGEPER